MPQSGSSTFTVENARSIGVEVAIETRNIELSDIAAIKERVSASTWKPAPGWGSPHAIFDAESGKVQIFSDAPKAEFTDILVQYEGKVNYPELGLQLASRRADYDPHWGGAEMDGPDAGDAYECTSGMAVNNPNGNPRMFTAGHCFLDNWDVDSPDGTTFGWVQNRSAYPPNGGSGVDAELVGGGSAGQQGRIYIGTSTNETHKKVAGAGDPGGFDYWCFSGATQWEQCELFIWDPDEDIEAIDQWGNVGVRVDSMVFKGPASNGVCIGDSGAPFYVYVESGARVKIGGMVWGTYANPFWTIAQCKMYSEYVIIHKWTHLRDTYNVTIKTNA